MIAKTREDLRRGFVLALVLMLMLAGSLALATAFQRQGVQRRVVNQQLLEYRRHHQMFGVRAIVGKWLREQSVAGLAQMAGEEDRSKEIPFDHAFELPEDVRVYVNVIDGQGAVLTDLRSVPNAMREQYEELLDRLPEDVPNLTRSVGPPEISINAAPREVIEGLIEGDSGRFATRLLRARDRRPIDQEEFDRAIRVTNVDEDDRAGLYALTTFQPELWQAVIDVVDEQGIRRFRMTLLQETGRIQVLSWIEAQPPEAPGRGLNEELEARDGRSSSRERSRSGDADRERDDS